MRNTGNILDRVEHRAERHRIGFQFVVRSRREIDIAHTRTHLRDHGLRVIKGRQGFFNLLFHGLEIQPARVHTRFQEIFGNWHDAVIGGECDDVIAFSYLLIQVDEEFPEVSVEPRNTDTA